MKREDWDFETQFQTALAQFDDSPELKTALITFYQAICDLFQALIGAEAGRKRGRDA